jgi:hypothetical protein
MTDFLSGTGGTPGPVKLPTVDEMVEHVLEQDRENRERQKAHRQRMNAFFDDLDRRGIAPDGLPMHAQHLIWVLDSGEPIHPKDSDYLKDVIRALTVSPGV